MSHAEAHHRGAETLVWIAVVVASGATLAVLAVTGVLPTDRIQELLLFDGVAVIAASLLARMTCVER